MPRNTTLATAAEGMHWLQAIEADTDRVIASLPARTDEELIDIRLASRGLGRAAWRIECAADAEIMRRLNDPRGRGRHDTEGRVIAAAVRDHADAVGVPPRTIYQNAQIHNTFFSSVGANTRRLKSGGLDHLEEKEYFRAALCAENPIEQIEEFARAKTEDPRFSTRDAWRRVQEAKTPPLDETIPALCDRADVNAAWAEFQTATAKLKAVAPRLSGLLKGYLEEIQYELSLPEQTIAQAIHDLISQGIDEADLIAERLQKDRIHVQVWLNRLCELDELESFEKERAPGARGQARIGYRANV